MSTIKKKTTPSPTLFLFENVFSQCYSNVSSIKVARAWVESLYSCLLECRFYWSLRSSWEPMWSRVDRFTFGSTYFGFIAASQSNGFITCSKWFIHSLKRVISIKVAFKLVLFVCTVQYTVIRLQDRCCVFYISTTTMKTNFNIKYSATMCHRKCNVWTHKTSIIHM